MAAYTENQGFLPELTLILCALYLSVPVTRSAHIHCSGRGILHALFSSTILAEDRVPKQYKRRTRLTMDERCIINLGQDSVYRNSCPTKIIENVDVNRIPKTIHEYECCRDGDISTKLLNNPLYCKAGIQFWGMKLMPNRECHQVMFNMVVLRKVGEGDKAPLYEKVYEPIQVGCSCTNPSRRRSSQDPYFGPTPRP